MSGAFVVRATKHTGFWASIRFTLTGKRPGKYLIVIAASKQEATEMVTQRLRRSWRVSRIVAIEKGVFEGGPRLFFFTVKVLMRSIFGERQ